MPGAELTLPVLTWVKFSPCDELTSIELYRHFFDSF